MRSMPVLQHCHSSGTKQIPRDSVTRIMGFEKDAKARMGTGVDTTVQSFLDVVARKDAEDTASA
jgi:hypothetical protein